MNNRKFKLRKLSTRFIYSPLSKFIKVWINLLYPILFHFKNKEFLYKKNLQNNVIVSFTSIPSRIDKVHYVVKSLLLQSYRPDNIILWLSKEDFPDVDKLPKSLTSLLQTDFEIRWCENIKPHKKYYFAMEENPKAIVITVDDDGLYRKNLIKDLMNSYKRFPNAISCTRAHKMVFDEKMNLKSYNEWEYESNYFNIPTKLLFATGVGGVLYPPGCLDQRAFDIKLIRELCLNADDIWLKVMGTLNNKSVVAIPSTKSKYVVGIINAEKISLSKNNVLHSDNDFYIKKVFEKFNVSYKDFKETNI
ncbi:MULTISPECIES: hypothetical protein [Priestia]|uniref:hypothetical protein n=1 Tax=Priestia TaxID=2800373 RepID=UPI0024053D5E|nr:MULTISPECIES: hypothetical protein [Priestia]MDG0060844.1 hypothetical protein [Priestia sp. P5]WDC89511.1 hypothetical protein PSR56_05640 [Priestia megaterium]